MRSVISMSGASPGGAEALGVFAPRGPCETPPRREQLLTAISIQERQSRLNWVAGVAITSAGICGAILLAVEGEQAQGGALASVMAAVAAVFFRNYRFHERQGQFYQLELGDLENRLLGYPTTGQKFREQAYFHGLARSKHNPLRKI